MVAVAKPQDATWRFQAAFSSQRYGQLPQGKALCKYTMADGVGSLQLWHERICHTCPQYLKTMVDKGLVRGIMLAKREHRTCDACHLGKQKRQTHWKKLGQATNEPNQVVYADLLIPGQSSAPNIVAVLIIMDGYSMFITIKLLTRKNRKKMNHHMQE